MQVWVIEFYDFEGDCETIAAFQTKELAIQFLENNCNQFEEITKLYEDEKTVTYGTNGSDVGGFVVKSFILGQIPERYL